jgi:hypothetical protein
MRQARRELVAEPAHLKLAHDPLQHASPVADQVKGWNAAVVLAAPGAVQVVSGNPEAYQPAEQSAELPAPVPGPPNEVRR